MQNCNKTQRTSSMSCTLLFKPGGQPQSNGFGGRDIHRKENLSIPVHEASHAGAELETHPGFVKCKQRAREALYWPGISAQIEDKVKDCTLCPPGLLEPEAYNMQDIKARMKRSKEQQKYYYDR
ncbi:hypothetical protein P5673_030130 [Acropora cervicornis]|uniref:Integrase zinc-binding domain-containing protein n=1 Tax=Acropora cervicornis TaxID=6130 RepID=A0AAD9UTT9_ACRCE|nr:hypothetical protein P5673_030130 [Acropora cervicornis]